MKRVHTVQVVPQLPEKLAHLREIAMDMHWAWHPDAIELFRRLDQDLWRDVDQNPVALLAQVSQERLDKAAKDGGFLSHLERVWLDFEVYRSERTWYNSMYPDMDNLHVAYFSAEFGLHESLPIYSGGLGVLSGDHLKAASDLGVPLTGIGLMYQKGYFRQYLNPDGWQQEKYPEIDVFHSPMELVLTDGGDPLEVSVRVGPREVALHVWLVKAGRVNLYLLDSNVLSNHHEDRRITEILYGGDSETRIRQEIVLGIGGIHTLHALGIDANVFHMNEGHSAFMALERIRRIMAEHELSFDEAREAAVVAHAFTTHTPVPAGIDKFSQDLMEKYFGDFWPSLGLDRSSFMKLGGIEESDKQSPFNMAIMAIRLSTYVNGVSKLHAAVSRGMWSYLWPSVSAEEAPIHSVRNGVHARSWISEEMESLFARYLSPKWQENPTDKDFWVAVKNISLEELWRAKERQKQRLVSFSRKRLMRQLRNRGESEANVEAARDVLDMGTLTIGFARRFATYKRANLLFRDPERLRAILTNPDHPVQIIFAGKAHPRDDGGKKLIREIVHYARDEEIRSKLVFLEDYDINVARHMVQGVDVWLNTPRRPLEASGTSGMKAAVNGALNCSTLDGWWADIFETGIGWAIGHGEEYEDEESQDRVESEILYDLLEKEIVELFYKRDRVGVPREWVKTIQRSLEKVCPIYFTTRMVEKYMRDGYLPCYQRYERMGKDQFRRARELSEWRKKVDDAWNEVKVLGVQTNGHMDMKVGEELDISVDVYLGDLAPDDVQVQVVYGNLAGDRRVAEPNSMNLELESSDSGKAKYKGVLTLQTTGNIGYAARVLPYHEDIPEPLMQGLVAWE